MGGQGAFVLAVEQALGLQLGLECVESLAQRAVTGRLDTVDDQLIVTATFIQADPAAGTDLLPVAHRESHPGGILAEQGTANLRAVILQGEVHVSGAGARQVGQLALDPDTREDVFQQLSGAGVELADAEHIRLGGQLLKQVVVVHGRILAGWRQIQVH